MTDPYFKGRIGACDIQGDPSWIDVQILSSVPFFTAIEFTFKRRQINFLIDEIASKGMGIAGFMGRSVTHYPQFGTMDEEGQVTSTLEQKVEAVKRFVVDIIQALDAIATYYSRSMLDYATWYASYGRDTYAKLVNRTACKLILQHKLTGCEKWEVVGFPEQGEGHESD